MHSGGFLPKVVLITSLVACVGCNRAVPTEAEREGGTVHIQATNHTTENLWIAYPMPSQVISGGTIELTQSRFRLSFARFSVMRSPTSPVATVDFALRQVPASTSDEWTATLSVTSDASGYIQVTSDKPEVLEVTAVTPTS